MRLAPRAKQIILRRLDLQKRQQTPQLVCTESAQLQFEGVLVAPGVSSPTEPTQQRKTALPTSDKALTRDPALPVVHIMVINLSHEEIELPKVTVLGVTEGLGKPGRGSQRRPQHGEKESPKQER
jgi:hypothetical protein